MGTSIRIYAFMEINPGHWATHTLLHILLVTFLDSGRWPWNWVTLIWLHQQLGPDPALILHLIFITSVPFMIGSKLGSSYIKGSAVFYSKADVVYIWSFLDIQESIDQSLPSGRAVHSYFPCISAVPGHVSQGPCGVGGWCFHSFRVSLFQGRLWPDRWV